MDFFAEQEAARRNTKKLVGLFLIAVIAIIAALYLVFVLILGYANTSELGKPIVLWQPQLFLIIASVTATVILLSSLFKVYQLSSGGGEAVAESLGGRRVERATEDQYERRLLNVVDEMAIASGTPAPQVFVLDDEEGINAFAAGSSPSEAVVAVTRGALEKLNRDELQGVVGHEFSHIFNGDMRLNIRLMGMLHGILMLALIGRTILRGGTRRSHYHSSSSGKGNGAGGLILFGLALFIIGYIGVFFGRLIKAAVSRQREFLADASAVQFSRNPAGIAGALKKIGGFESTQLEHPDAEAASHMFFGNGVNTLLSLLATHPPVEERISRLDPYFKAEGTTRRSPSSYAPGEAAMGFSSGITTEAISAESVAASIGNSDQRHLDFAHDLIENLPEPIWKALRHPHGAQMLVRALILADDREPAATLGRTLPDSSAEERSEVVALASAIRSVGRDQRLPLLELAIPVLEELPLERIEAIPDEVDALIRADKKVTLFEFSLATLLRHTLARHTSPRERRHHGGMEQIRSDAGQLFSLLAHSGHKDPNQAKKAFELAVATFQVDGVEMIERKGLSLKAVEVALENLSRLNYRFKERLLKAATTAITSDGEVKVSELDLLRAIGASLDCPIPPLQVGTHSGATG